MKTNILLVAAFATSFLSTARSAEEASAAGTAEKIESVDLEKTFGPIPAPKDGDAVCLRHQNLNQ